jgi:hypothetical protein
MLSIGQIQETQGAPGRTHKAVSQCTDFESHRSCVACVFDQAVQVYNLTLKYNLAHRLACLVHALVIKGSNPIRVKFLLLVIVNTLQIIIIIIIIIMIIIIIITVIAQSV